MTRTSGRVIREVALWVGALLGLLAVAAGVGVACFGLHFLVFRSGSMAPDITTGSLALSRETAAGELRPGQVATVTTATGATVSHRIVSVTRHGERASLVLQGDANASPDAEDYEVTSAPRVLVSVPWAGYAVTYLLSPLGLVVALCLSGALVVSTFPASSPQERPGRRARQASPRRPRRRAASVAVGAAVVVVGTGAAASGVDGTLASFTDRPTLRSGALTTATVTASTSITCSSTARANDPMRIAVPVHNSRYTYVLRLYTTAGAKVGADVAMAGTPTAEASLTPAAVGNAVGNFSYGTYVARVYSQLSGSSWESTSYRSYSFDYEATLLGILRPALDCGAAGA